MAKNDRSDSLPTTVDPSVTDVQLASNPMLALRPADVRDKSWDELMAELDGARGGVIDAAQTGDGYRVVEGASQKAHLVGVPFVILPGWRVNPSDKIPGRYFTTFHIKTRHPVAALGDWQHFIINDGSTGIAQQLEDRWKATKNAEQYIVCRRGLSKSDYPVTEDERDENGDLVIDENTHRPRQKQVVDPLTQQPVFGTTYYIDQSS